MVKWSLGTKDNARAREAWPGALARWAEMTAGWEKAASAITLTPEKAGEMAARWAAHIAQGAPLDMGTADAALFDALNDSEAEPEALARIGERIRVHAQEAEGLVDYAITPESRPLLGKAMVDVVHAAYLQVELASQGVQGAALPLAPFESTRRALPPVEVLPALAPLPGLSFDDAWKRWKLTATVNPRSVYETQGILKSLEGFLGHDDATRLTRADLLRWRDHLKADGLSNNTWNNRLSFVRGVLQRAVDDGLLPEPNPCEKLRLAKEASADRYPFSDEEAASILNAARKETSPSLRWAHWVMAFSGMRAGEVLQLTGDDIRKDDRSGVWYIVVRPDPEAGKRVKNGQTRHVPIHPALEAEGFLRYAQGIGKGEPLFPDKITDKYGSRGGRAWNAIGKWVRRTVGITDPKKAPNHSWRHRFEDELRAAEVVESQRDAIVGHARKTVGRSYGVQGEGLGRLYREISLVPLPVGVPPLGASALKS